MKTLTGWNLVGCMVLATIISGCGETTVEPTVTAAYGLPTQAELVVSPPTQAEQFPTMAATSTLSPTLSPPTEVPPAGVPLPLTPAQTEGPYYPVEKPADRDNDLTRVAGQAGQAEGEVLLLQGRLLTENGQPIPGAVIEIWQTDANGIYLHPNDPGVANRDAAFQSYGEAVTAADGSYAFRTILPGFYGGRPEHIHVKVKLNGAELLTTQFYFGGDERLNSDSIAEQAGSSVVMQLQPGTDELGNPVWTATQDIVLPASMVPVQ